MSAPKVVIDTSLWVDHINGSDLRITALLRRHRVVMHPMIVAELALGSIRDRTRVLTELRELPSMAVASDEELLAKVDQLELGGSGIGYVDAHLVVAALLAPETKLLTRDKPLRRVAERLSLSADLD